jgi:hypothetical protein
MGQTYRTQHAASSSTPLSCCVGCAYAMLESTRLIKCYLGRWPIKQDLKSGPPLQRGDCHGRLLLTINNTTATTKIDTTYPLDTVCDTVGG